jgi:hypothetical protein
MCDADHCLLLGTADTSGAPRPILAGLSARSTDRAAIEESPMSDRTWHKGWNGLDENPERHSGCPHDHHASYRDDEPHMRFRGGRSDIHQDRCDPPEHHPRNDYGDRERDQDGSPDGSVQPHDGGNRGWDDAGGSKRCF